MPAVRIELARFAAGRRVLWAILLVATLALSGGERLPLTLTLLALLLAFAGSSRSPAGILRFDGRDWWLQRDNRRGEKLCPGRSGYAGAALVALHLRGEHSNYPLLLWRWQLDRESWRRLRLAVRYGVSTVSTASGALPG